MNDRAPGELPGWSLVWSDEFVGAAGSPVNPAVWQPEVGGHGWGNKELQYYTDSTENAALDGAGNLAITVRRPDPQLAQRRFSGCRYTSARLTTKDRVFFAYSMVQARIRLPEGRGIWPAFWMLGQNIDEVGWPACGEIDVMENFGKDPAVVHGTVHGPATRAPTASPPPTTPGSPSPTTSTSTRSNGSPNASAGIWTTSATAPSRQRVSMAVRGCSTTTSTCSSTWPSVGSSPNTPTARQPSRRQCSSTTSVSTPQLLRPTVGLGRQQTWRAVGGPEKRHGTHDGERLKRPLDSPSSLPLAVCDA